MPADFDWIFFDCFNTLVDDFDPTGDESGLGTLPALAVTEGLFANTKEFLNCYRLARNDSSVSGQETLFDQRLHRTLAASPARLSEEKITALIGMMLRHWEKEYLQLLRITPGAVETVNYWATRKKLGVVSNFFLPHHPARYLRGFGLGVHFDFILDSAAFGFKKPHPSIFIEAMRLAKLEKIHAERVLFVGDRLDLDIFAARDFGMQVVHFNRSKSRPGVAETPSGIRAIYDLAELR